MALFAYSVVSLLISFGASSQLTPRAEAAFAGRNGRILFEVSQPPYRSLSPPLPYSVVGDYDLFTVNSDGSALRQVTAGAAVDGQSRWSPDGNRIVFLRTDVIFGRVSGTDIYMVNADGTGETNVSNTPDFLEFAPSWSSDGQKIVFSSDRANPDLDWRQTHQGDPEFDLYTMDADGSDIARLTSDPGAEFYPAWSPDGDSILFSQRSSIEVISVDGKERRVLIETGYFTPGAQWSPDGSRIAFSRVSGPDILVMNADGSHLRNLTARRRDNNRAPAWSPDGKWIAFASDRDGSWKLYKMRSDGSHTVKLVDIDLQSPDTLVDWGTRP